MDTHISLSPDLKAKIEREANARGMSLDDFVCRSLEWAISQNPSVDSMFADRAVYRDNGPEDYSSDHDKYLYEDAS